jgi:Ca2+-binding EF-hand superfamily protein
LKQSILLLSASLLLAGCAGTGSSFHTMDLDGNGVISRGEFTDAVADISFASCDRNHDGFLDLGEWRGGEKGAGNEALFRLRDMSRNGKISRQESRLAAEKNGSLVGLFASIDANRDGFIDSAEARRYQSVLKSASR